MIIINTIIGNRSASLRGEGSWTPLLNFHPPCILHVQLPGADYPPAQFPVYAKISFMPHKNA